MCCWKHTPCKMVETRARRRCSNVPAHKSRNSKRIPFFFTLDTVRTTTPENQLAMVRSLVQKLDADVRAVICSGAQKCEYYLLYDAAMGCAHNVVAFFMDECGMDINIRTPRTQSIVLHSLVRTPVRDEGEALRMLKYLIEERGADYTLKSTDGYDAISLAVICGVPLYSRYFAPGGTTTQEVDPATFKRYRKRERRKDAAKAAAKDEAAAKALFDEQEAKAKEAAATLLAELEAEDRRAAAAAGNKKPKKANKKKGAGDQQAISAAAAASIAAEESAVSGAADIGLEESKKDDKKLASQSEEDQEQQRQGQEQQEQEQEQQRQRRDAMKDTAAIAAVMGNLSLEVEEKARATASSSVATTKGEDGDRKMPASAQPRKGVKEGEGSEQDLEEEKHVFFLDGAADGMKCSVGFCLMTEAVVAMDGFSHQKSSLEKYIAHCAATGQPLTSPLTGEPMGEMYMPNHHVRTYVKDYIGEREKEWRLHVARRRAGREGK